MALVVPSLEGSLFGQAPKPKAKPGATTKPVPGAAKKTTGTTPQPKVAQPGPPVDANGVPIGFTPPPKIPEMMTLDQPLLTEADQADWKKIRSKYATALRNGSMAPADKQLILQGLKYRLYVMTLKDQQRELHERRMELVASDLQQAGKILKPEDVKEFRRFLMAEIVKLAEPLFANNFYVRLQAATLLGELDLQAADAPRNLKHETYTDACELLIKVLQDPEQPAPVKIAAARSMVRLLRFGDAPVDRRHRVAQAVLPELAKADTHYWYQMRLAEVLSTLDVTIDLQSRRPFVVIGLLDVVKDPKRDFRARAEAARALGRVPFDPQVDISSVMRSLAELTQEMATANLQAPKDPKWKQCFFNVYLAFKPLGTEDKEASRKLPAGLLANPQTQSAAQPTYKLIVPLVNAVLADKPVAVPDVQALQAWLQQNAPVAQNPPGGQRPAPAPGGQPAANAPAPK